MNSLRRSESSSGPTERSFAFSTEAREKEKLRRKEGHKPKKQHIQVEENNNQQVNVANHPQQIAETDQQNGQDVENDAHSSSHGPHETVGGSPQNGNFSSFPCK